ncbi:MAG: uroporphyrinogen decarboxylase [Chitinophagales bacterium]
MQLKNDLLLQSALGKTVERTPVWLMRQAGRILPQYRAIRSKLSGFKELVQTPELACEVTIQPVDELDVDAAIIFSDILEIPEAMGLPYTMVESKGPIFPKTIHSQADVDALKIADGATDIHYTIEAIKLTKQALNGRVPLIGFSGCPWTIFAYMIEGSGSKTFSKARRMLYQQPEMSHQLMQKITLSILSYIKAQVAAGADLIQLFDSWAGILPPQQYSEFSLPYISQLCDAMEDVPVTVFAKGAYFAREELGRLNCEVIGLDWNMSPTESRKLIGNQKTLQGNFDPCLLYADQSTIRREVRKMLESFGTTRHIANLGHGVYPDTPLDNVKCFVDTVKEYNFSEIY